MLSSTAGSYLSAPDPFLLSVLTLVHSPFIDKEELELFYKAFSSIESALDSNGRELLAILYSLKPFKSFRGKVVNCTRTAKMLLSSRAGAVRH